MRAPTISVCGSGVGAGRVRVVDAHLVRVRAEIEDLVIGQRLDDGIAEVDAAVVEGDGDLHATRSRSAAPRAVMLSRL